jgi:hypothetical protein
MFVPLSKLKKAPKNVRRAAAGLLPLLMHQLMKGGMPVRRQYGGMGG